MLSVFVPIGRADSEQSKDSEEKVLVSSGEVMFISDLPVSKDLVDADYGTKCYLLPIFVQNLKKKILKNVGLCFLLCVVVSHALVYGLWSGAAITVFGVFGLVVAVFIRRVRPQPAPV